MYVRSMTSQRNWRWQNVHTCTCTCTFCCGRQKFNEVAFEARDRSDLLHALNEFLDDALVLPPGELDKKTLLPVLNMAKEKTRLRKRRRKEKEGEAS